MHRMFNRCISRKLWTMCRAHTCQPFHRHCFVCIEYVSAVVMRRSRVWRSTAESVKQCMAYICEREQKKSRPEIWRAAGELHSMWSVFCRRLQPFSCFGSAHINAWLIDRFVNIWILLFVYIFQVKKKCCNEICSMYTKSKLVLLIN